MEDLKCPACGAGVEAGAFFCAGCGGPINTVTAQPDAAAANTGESQPAAQELFSQAAAPQPTAAPVSPQGGMDSAAAMGVGAPPPAPGYGYPPNAYGAQPGPYGTAPAPQPMPQPVVRDETVSVWSYIWPDLLVYIPFLGWIAWLIVMIVLAASGDKPSYRNFAKARLLMLAIGVGLAIITVMLFGAMLSSAFYNYF